LDRVLCPRCRSENVEHRWIPKIETTEVKDIDFDEYANQLKEEASHWSDGWNITNDFVGSSWSLRYRSLSQYQQLVIECKACGFTRVFELDGVKEKES
jgi:predicted nucleic-acid-binding Zn-ribbon protein